jgi:hypothetical protein
MTRDNRIALCVIARDNGLTFCPVTGLFRDKDGVGYIPTPLGLRLSVNHNYHLLYLEQCRQVEKLRYANERLIKENAIIRQEVIHKKSRSAILAMIESDLPENVITKLKEYLT